MCHASRLSLAILVTLFVGVSAVGDETGSYYTEATESLVRGEINDAIASCDQAIKRGLKAAKVYRCRAFATLLVGRPKEAIEDFKEAIKLDPSDAGLYYGRAIAHRFLRNDPAASDDLATALRLYPDYAAASMIRRKILREFGSPVDWVNEGMRMSGILRRGRWASDPIALGFGRQMNRFRDRGPIDLEGHLFYLAWEFIYEESPMDTGNRPVLTAPPPAPQDSAGLYESAFRSALRRDWKQSLDDLKRLARLSPGDGRIYRTRAVVRILKGDMKGAVEDLTNAIAINPKDSRSYGFRSCVFEELGEYNKSTSDLLIANQLKRDETSELLKHSGQRPEK